MADAILPKDGCHVGFGNVIGKGTITGKGMGIRLWLKVFVPVQNALGDGINFIGLYRRCKAGKQHAKSNAVNRLVDYRFCVNRRAQIDATFEE